MEIEDPVFILLDIAAYIYVFFMGYKLFSSNFHFEYNRVWRRIISSSWVITLTLLFLHLRYLASYDVINSPYYIVGYMSFGFLWSCFSVECMENVTDIHFDQDIRERNNNSASIVHGAFIISSGITFSGANVGNGPGWEVVLFTASLSTIFLLIMTFMINIVAQYSEKVTVLRDQNAAIRFSAHLIGTSIILDRAAAGDWISASATINDYFCRIWFLPFLLFSLAMIERKRKHPNDESSLFTMMYALLILASSIAYVWKFWRI